MWARNETDEKVKSYNDLVAISQGIFPLPDDVPFHRAGDVDPIIKPNKMIGNHISLYARELAKQASSLIENYSSRNTNDVKQKQTISIINTHSERNKNHLGDHVPGQMGKDFVAEFCKTLKSLNTAVTRDGYLYSQFSHDGERNLHVWRGILLRILNHLILISSTKLEESNIVALEVLKDQEALKTIKEYFLYFMKLDLSRGDYNDLEDFMEQQSHERSMDKIWKEFSNKDKHDLISCLIKQSAAEFVEIHGSNDIDMSKTVKATQMQNLMKFFSETPGALEKLATPSEEFMARDLLTLVSVSDQGKSHYEWTSMLTIMYIAEFLINDKNSKFGEFHKIEIEEYKIVPKLELLRKLTEVNKKVSKLLPRMLKIKTTENSEVWERLKNENLSTWYKEYLQKLQSLEDEIGSDLKRLSVYREVNKYHLPRTEASETNGDLGCWSATGMAELLFGHISVPPVKITDSIKFLETQKGIFKKAKQRDFVSSSIRKKMSKFNQVLQKSKSNIFLSYI